MKHSKRRMRIKWRIAVVRESIHHTRTPGVASKEPIDTGLFQCQEAFITTQFSVEVTLNGKRSRQVIGAPYKRHTTIEGILVCFFPYPLDSFPVIGNERRPIILIAHLSQFVVP